jgi:hypothetical protein
MNTKKQEELVNTWLSQFGDEIKPLYHDIILYLGELGYSPKKEKSSISFKHDLHNKQMAKMGTKTSKKKGSSPFFALRFSACHGYSQRFTDIVRYYIAKYPTRAARCMDNGCNFCAGEAATHVYTCTFPDGESKSHCGAYAIEIPDITVDDIAEIKKLIQEEHVYLIKHQAGIAAF